MNTSSKHPARKQRVGDAEQRVAAHQVDLVQRQHGAAAGSPTSWSTMRRVSGSSGARRVDQQHDPVGIGGAGPGGGDHRAVEPAARREDAGRVDKDQLRLALDRDAEQPGARRLHLRGDDRQLVADQPVEQRRLAGIRRPDQRDIAAARFAPLRPSCLTLPRLRGRGVRVGPAAGEGLFGCVFRAVRLPVFASLSRSSSDGGGGGLGGAFRAGGGACLLAAP